MLGVVRDHVAGEPKDPPNPLVRRPVIPVSPLSRGGYVPAPTQTRQMTRHPPLGYAEGLDELGHGALSLEEQFEDFQASRVAESTEKFGLEL